MDSDIWKNMNPEEVKEACIFYKKYHSPEEAKERVRLKRNDRALKAVLGSIANIVEIMDSGEYSEAYEKLNDLVVNIAERISG